MIRLLSVAWHLLALGTLGSYLFMLVRNLRWMRRLEDEPAVVNHPPHIAILTPARNEAENLPRCLDSLLQQNYPEFTITVLDDRSEDATRDVVQSYADRDRRVRLLDGQPLPDGWIGKPWACQQLAGQAEGDVLLFIDADTWFEPDSLSRAAGLMQRERPGLLSVLARQETGTFAERLVLPGLYMLFLCNIPFWKLEDPAYPGVAAANGQFLCFDREVYWKIGGHESVKAEIIEDLALAGVIKRSGYRLTARSAVDIVHCRMYRSWRDVLDGFSKNAYNATGERPERALLFVGALLGTQVLPAAVATVSLVRGDRSPIRFWLPLVETLTLILTRYLASSAMRFRRSDAVYAPLAASVAIAIMLRSIWWKYRSGYEWKGRRIT